MEDNKKSRLFKSRSIAAFGGRGESEASISRALAEGQQAFCITHFLANWRVLTGNM